MEEWDKQIILDASTRLFKNCNIPEKVINISKEKVPRLLELISNAPIHIITQQVSNYVLKKQQNNEYEKSIQKHLLNYLIIEKTMKTPEIDLPKPQTNNIKDLIEYQNIYQFYIQKITLSNYEQAYKEASDLTNEILNDNYKDKKNITLKTEHLDRLNKIRENITNGNKNLLIQWEEILECSNEKFIEANYKEAMKRKPGRPKADKKEKGENQMMIENFFHN